MTLSVVDLFAGAGGLSLGFKQAGYKILAAVEASKHQTETYTQNFPDIKVQHQDIQDVYAESFMGVVDVVIGAPPYEAFLATNPDRKKDPRARLYDDPHGALVLDFVDFLTACQPKAFVLELVPDFAEDEIMQALGEELNKAGFEQVYVSFLNAADYGATTDRVSLFISSHPLEPAPDEEGGHAVGDLVEMVKEGVPNHEKEDLSEERMKELEKLNPGDFLEPIALNGSTAEDEVYPNWFRLIPEATAPPLYGFSRFVHPFEPRLITVRETARLMGFPDKFVFGGNRSTQYESVGNAVPPPLAYAVAETLKQVLVAPERKAKLA
jgi:DNA (cytosine-5)-methyltransferase 1